MKPLIIILLLWNVITFMMMGIDKYKAKHDKQRISEKTLLTSAFIMGAIGIGMGMKMFHHKTLKRKFKIGVPLAVIVNVAVVYWMLYYNIV